MSVASLENGSDNMCVDCEVRLLKLNRKYFNKYANRSLSVVSLENLNGVTLNCIKLEQLDTQSTFLRI